MMFSKGFDKDADEFAATNDTLLVSLWYKERCSDKMAKCLPGFGKCAEALAVERD